MTATDQLLFEGADWDFRTLQRICDACEQVSPAPRSMARAAGCR